MKTADVTIVNSCEGRVHLKKAELYDCTDGVAVVLTGKKCHSSSSAAKKKNNKKTEKNDISNQWVRSHESANTRE